MPRDGTENVIERLMIEKYMGVCYKSRVNNSLAKKPKASEVRSKVNKLHSAELPIA